MALSNAEKVRRYRERQKQKREEEHRKGLSPALRYKTPSWDYFSYHGSDFELCLALAGIEAPVFEDDRGPEHFVLNGATDGVDEPFGDAQDCVGRAEVIVGCLIDAAAELASLINRYKRTEIEQRVAEIEQSDLSDPAARKSALAELAYLNRMQEQLNKQLRWTFPQWKATGD